MQYLTTPLCVSDRDFRFLFTRFGPSLGFWRAAEVAALREAGLSGEAYAVPVLDLGCGDGLVSSLVFHRIAVALDPDQTALTRATGTKVPVLGQVPIDVRLREGGDNGQPLTASDPDSPAAQVLIGIADKIATRSRGLVGMSLNVSPVRK